ncbi:hypothetical protein ST47_g1657 [Ascochyta rabiei]|uniref:Uncharacterized protein n=1 Tax=Didymella rabiei TaxID=5454 RepID=A0A163KR71_DIDRA|nr:hypothetical protein ST47_g1657 [Ascochyta rabiei]
MHAQDSHGDSALTDRPAAKRRSRHPAKFMFIDSSNGGVNAKPDRVVRSFVMKSVRNKKTWSTRPKSPREEEYTETLPLRFSAQQTNVQPQHTSAMAAWDPQNCREDSLWDSSPLASPASSGCMCDSPSSGYASPFRERYFSECPYNFQVDGQTKLAIRDGFDVGFTRSFDCLSVSLDSHTQRLLHQFVEGSAPRLVPVDLYSPNGAPYIYAALTASARAVGLSSEAYKWRAITEVNKLLSNPKTSTDDTTIAAVLMLLALEESGLADPRRWGSDREWSQRGGLAALGANRCLQVFILMHSVAQSITTFKRPYALLLNPMGRIENYVLVSQHSQSWASLSTSIENLNLDDALFDVIHSVHLFTSDLTSWYNTGHAIHPLDPFELQKHACLLMYRLFDWYQLGEESKIAGRPGRKPFDQSICLAHLIYLSVAVEPHTHSFGSRLSMTVVKLRQALQRVSILHWVNLPELFFWTLTMGALGAKGLPQSQQSCASEFAFFVQYSQLSSVSRGHNAFVSADDLLQRMQHCPWISSVFDAHARRLWVQMGLCRTDITNLFDSSSEEEEAMVGDEHAVGQSTTARFFPALKSTSKKSSPK